MRVGYARAALQDRSPQPQLDALVANGCERIFYEKAAGNPRKRPELELCLEALSKGDTLVVWRLDRLGRSFTDLVNTINVLEGRGIGFESIEEKINTHQPGGQWIFQVFAGLAGFERALIRERTLVGMAAAQAKGLKYGRNVKMSKTDVDRAAVMLKEESMTKAEVARIFGVSRVTLDAALKREGYRQAFGTEKDGTHT